MDSGGASVLGPALRSVSIVSSGTTPDGRWLSTGDEDEGIEGEDAPDTDSDASEAAFDSNDSAASDVAPVGRVWAREDSDCPQFVFRNRPDDAVFLVYLLPKGPPHPDLARADLVLTYVGDASQLPTALGMHSESARRRNAHEDTSRAQWHLLVKVGPTLGRKCPPILSSPIFLVDF